MLTSPHLTMGKMICTQLPKASTHLLFLTLALSNLHIQAKPDKLFYLISVLNPSTVITLGNYPSPLCPAPGKPLKSLTHQHHHLTAHNPLYGLCTLNVASLNQSLYFIVLKYQISSEYLFCLDRQNAFDDFQGAVQTPYEATQVPLLLGCWSLLCLLVLTLFFSLLYSRTP